MAISVEKARQHINRWSDQLSKYTPRAFWPRYLFHTCDITVAETILSRGYLLSRNQAQQETGLICDVANQGAVWNNPAAHDYVRLYFRPRNSFHLKTEGIKSLSDPYRHNPHMSIPVAFLFDFETVMSFPQTYFLGENFALEYAQPMHGDSNFEALNFSEIYHDSAVTAGNKDRIHRARMAEAVVTHGLSLLHCKAILLRTTHDKTTLKYLSSASAETSREFFVAQRGGVFFKRGIFIQEAYYKDQGIIFSFCAPYVAPQDTYRVSIQHGSFVATYSLAASKRWRVPSKQPPELPVRIDIEECLAFKGLLPASESEVV